MGGRQEDHSQKGGMTTETEGGVTHFEDGGRDHKSRKQVASGGPKM